MNKFALKAVIKKKKKSMMSISILKECQLSKVEQKGILIIAFKNFANTWIVIDFMAVSKVYKAFLWPEEPLTALLLFSFHVHTNSQSYG